MLLPSKSVFYQMSVSNTIPSILTNVVLNSCHVHSFFLVIDPQDNKVAPKGSTSLPQVDRKLENEICIALGFKWVRGLILLIIWDHTNGLVKYGRSNNPKVGDYRPILDSHILIHSSGTDTSRFYPKMPTLLYSNLVYSRIQTANQLYSVYNSTISRNNTNPYWITRTFWLWRISLASTFIARLPLYKKSSSLCTWTTIGMVTSPCMHVMKIKPITWGQPASMAEGHTRSPKWNASTPSPIGWSSPLKQGHAQWMVFVHQITLSIQGKYEQMHIYTTRSLSWDPQYTKLHYALDHQHRNKGAQKNGWFMVGTFVIILHYQFSKRPKLIHI